MRRFAAADPFTSLPRLFVRRLRVAEVLRRREVAFFRVVLRRVAARRRFGRERGETSALVARVCCANP